jgi:sulfopyruvate decarboxylase subunit beta
LDASADNHCVQHPSGAAIIDSIKHSGVRFIVSVPDIVTSDGLLWPISTDPDLELLRVCKEDEGVSICGAMSYNDTRALLLMQQTGLMDSLNAIRAIGMDYQLPVCMMVGLQGKEAELKSADSKSYGVRIIEPVLNAMQIRYRVIEEPEDVDHISRDIDQAYQTSSSFVFIIARPPGA